MSVKGAQSKTLSILPIHPVECICFLLVIRPFHSVQCMKFTKGRYIRKIDRRTGHCGLVALHVRDFLGSLFDPEVVDVVPRFLESHREKSGIIP
jgi:hypothetical protein